MTSNPLKQSAKRKRTKPATHQPSLTTNPTMPPASAPAPAQTARPFNFHTLFPQPDPKRPTTLFTTGRRDSNVLDRKRVACEALPLLVEVGMRDYPDRVPTPVPRPHREEVTFFKTKDDTKDGAKDESDSD